MSRDARAVPAAISVVVPVYNGEATLARCLAPLVAFAVDGEIAELIVVDDGSTDASAWIAAEAGARVVPSGGRVGPGGAGRVHPRLSAPHGRRGAAR